MNTNAQRYTVEQVETKAPNDTKLVVYYIWDRKSNLLVKTHHMKPVIEKSLDMLLGNNG